MPHMPMSEYVKKAGDEKTVVDVYDAEYGKYHAPIKPIEASMPMKPQPKPFK